jgi:hypothetical protein
VLALSCNDGGGAGTARPMPVLRETYLKNDTKPFGGSVAYRLLDELYPGDIKNTKKEDIDETWRTTYDTGALYVAICKSLYTSDEDADAVFDYVKAGNDMLLSASVFDDNLLDKIGCRIDHTADLLNTMSGNLGNTFVKLNPQLLADSAQYNYYYLHFANYFNQLPEKNYRIVGYNENGKPNSIVCFIGKGRLFLQCDPRAFSNYFLLQKDNYKYMQQLLSLTKKSPQHVYWNDYYVNLKYPRSSNGSGGSRNSSSGNSKASSLDQILNNPSLSFAFWLVLCLLIIYVLYGLKRKQRIVEKLKPNENTSVTFTETIGRLYLQKKDNRNIAEKMITYFNEFIRNQYFLNTNHVNEDFVTTLGRKSGVERQDVEALYNTINLVTNKIIVSDLELLQLNSQIQNFYKNKI